MINLNNYKNMREEFLNIIEKESTKRSFLLIFKKVKEYEEEIEKTIEDMDTDELRTLLNTVLVGKSIESTNVKLSTLRKYLKYAGNKDILNLNKDDVRKAVEMKNADKEEEIDVRYINRNDLYLAMNRIENDIDKAIVVLLANGICGYHFVELQNLKVADIDFETNTIKLDNRTVEISEGDMDIIKEGIKQEEYIKVLKSVNSVPTVEGYKFNMASPYVIKNRPKVTNSDGLDPYKFSGITNRMFRVMQQLCLDNITALDIVLSYAVDMLIVYAKEIGNMNLSANEIGDYVTNNLGIKLSQRNLFDCYYSLVGKK